MPNLNLYCPMALFCDGRQTTPTLRPTFCQIVIRLRQPAVGTVPVSPASTDNTPMLASALSQPSMPTVSEDASFEKLLVWLVDKCGISKDLAARQS